MTETADSTPCLFSLFYKSTLLCCYYDYIQIKVDPLQFQTIPYSYLYDQNRVFLVLLWSSRKKQMAVLVRKLQIRPAEEIQEILIVVAEYTEDLKG